VGFLGGAETAAVRRDPIAGARLAADGLALLGDVARSPGAAWLWLGDYGDPLYRAGVERRQELLARVADPREGLAAAAAVLALWEAEDAGTPTARAAAVRRLGDVARASTAAGWRDLALLTARVAAQEFAQGCVRGPAPTDKDPSPVAPSDPAVDAVRALAAVGDDAGVQALIASLQTPARRQAARRAARRWRPRRRGPDEAARAAQRALDAGDLPTALKTLARVDTDDPHAVAELAAQTVALALPEAATARAWEAETVRGLSVFQGRTQTAWLLALAARARALGRPVPDTARAALVRSLTGASRWRPPKTIPTRVVPAPLEAGLQPFGAGAPIPAKALGRRAQACAAWADPAESPQGASRATCRQGPPRVPLTQRVPGSASEDTSATDVAWLEALAAPRDEACQRVFLVKRRLPATPSAARAGAEPGDDQRELLGLVCRAADEAGGSKTQDDRRAAASFETTRRAWRRVGELLERGFLPAKSLVSRRAVDVVGGGEGEEHERLWVPLVALGAPLDRARILLARRPRAVELTLVAPDGRRARVLRRWAAPPPCDVKGAARAPASGDAEAPVGRVEDVLLGADVLVVRGATYGWDGAERRWTVTVPAAEARPPTR